MKKLFAGLCLLLLTACAPKVLFVKDTDAYRAVFTDVKCPNQEIMAKVEMEGLMAKQMGVPEDVISKVSKSFKEGAVHFKQTGEDRQFCYTSEQQQPGTVFIIDTAGLEFSMAIKAPEPVKND